ncbi:MAG: 50S ribosomal protein L15 [Candidatus Cloacimonadota bacterium]|nr:MAG: 50S ribosomal protein L15 [Candidatus Cloacimonadota bacterium]
MKLHEITPPKGAKKRKKRLGTGSSSGHGGTCGKGSKGQRSRSGAKSYPWFEGGQMPLQRRIPKRGMTPRRRRVFQIINVKELNCFEDGTIVDMVKLKEKGLIKKENIPVKILGNGHLKKNLTVKASSFSKSAIEIITSTGGKAEITGA